jgi:predicted MFS family arabinose efflux permease
MNPWHELKKLPRGMWIIFITTLINRAGTMVLPFLILYLTQVLKFSPGRAGFVLTLYGVGALFTAPLSGWLADRYGTLLIMKLSLFLSGLMILIFPLAQSFVAVSGAVLVLAIVTEMFRPASMAIVSHLVDPSQRKTAFAVSRLAINLGMSIGPAIGGLLAAVSFYTLFFIDAATSLLAGIVLAFSGLRVSVPPHETDPSAEGMKNTLKDRHLLYFLAAVVPICFVFFQHVSTMPLFFVQNLELSEVVYGLMFTVNTLLIVLLEVPLNLVTSHWSHRKTLVTGTILCSIGYGAFAFSAGLWSVTVAVVIWTFGEMILFPGMSSYVAHIAPARSRGAYMGLFTMAFALAFAIAPWTGTKMFEVLGGRNFWIAIFIIGTISAALMAFIGREEKTASALPT